MKPYSTDLQTLRNRLLKSDYQSILKIAKTKKRILSLLTALTYDENPVVCENAIEASGLVAKFIAERDSEHIRNYLLRLFWLVNDESGGIGWRAPELIGEILHQCPQFNQFFPMLISLLDLEEDAPRFRTGTLWAIGRVAQAVPDAMLPVLPMLLQYLTEDSVDEPSKAMALWCMEQFPSGLQSKRD